MDITRYKDKVHLSFLDGDLEQFVIELGPDGKHRWFYWVTIPTADCQEDDEEQIPDKWRGAFDQMYNWFMENQDSIGVCYPDFFPDY